MKKIDLNQMENLQGGEGGWKAYAGQLALGAVCTLIGVAAVAGFACGAMFSAFNIFNT